MSDWRLQGQEKYLLGVDLKKSIYKKYSEKWEHDHCEFCGNKFSETLPNTLHEGYSTLNNYHWICEDCFSDFKETFNWKTIT